MPTARAVMRRNESEIEKLENISGRSGLEAWFCNHVSLFPQRCSSPRHHCLWRGRGLCTVAHGDRHGAKSAGNIHKPMPKSKKLRTGGFLRLPPVLVEQPKTTIFARRKRTEPYENSGIVAVTLFLMSGCCQCVFATETASRRGPFGVCVRGARRCDTG